MRGLAALMLRLITSRSSRRRLVLVDGLYGMFAPNTFGVFFLRTNGLTRVVAILMLLSSLVFYVLAARVPVVCDLDAQHFTK